MSPWRPLNATDSSGCNLTNASIRWMSSLDIYHATGTVEIQHVAEVPGLFRLFIDATTVNWKENGIKEPGHPIKHCIYLPTDDGTNWTVSSGRKKSSHRPDYKAFVVAVQFPPNSDGISAIQVCVEVVNNDTSDGVRFAEALTYAANTIVLRPTVSK